MCAILGLWIRSKGTREESARVLVANHVSTVDHAAVDILSPCILPSVWDIPNILRWTFGYADLGARTSREELVRQARAHIAGPQSLPLLAFPEGAMTSGRRALLKFSSWPFALSDVVQPVSISIYRPFFPVAPYVLGSSWWEDLFYFAFLPLSILTVHFLPVQRRREAETDQEFALRVSKIIASDLNIEVSSHTSHDAVEEAKRRLKSGEQLANRSRRTLTSRQLDNLAMNIKQSHPAIPLLTIRQDLDRTKDAAATVARIVSGELSAAPTPSKSLNAAKSDPSQWRRLFDERKWVLIEQNRERYLERMRAQLAES